MNTEIKAIICSPPGSIPDSQGLPTSEPRAGKRYPLPIQQPANQNIVVMYRILIPLVSDAVITPLSSDTARGSSEMIVLGVHQ
mgnify:CR=1 FL=1